MANIHETYGGIDFYGREDILGREDNITLGDPPGSLDLPDISSIPQNQDRNTVGIGTTRSVETEAPIVVPSEDEYIIGNRINFLCFNYE